MLWVNWVGNGSLFAHFFVLDAILKPSVMTTTTNSNRPQNAIHAGLPRPPLPLPVRPAKEPKCSPRYKLAESDRPRKSYHNDGPGGSYAGF